MQQETVLDVPSKYLHKPAEETFGGPLDKRIYLPFGLNWDLIRENYAANANPIERTAQRESLESPTGKYKVKKGKYVKEEEEDVEEQWKKAHSRDPLSAATVRRIRQYTDLGMSQKNIAKDLNINIKTVSRYQDKYQAEKEEKENGDA